MYTYIIFIMHVNYVDIYIYVQTKGTGTSLASHHFRSASAGPSFIRIHPIRIHPLPLACSPWTFRSPVQVHVSFQLHFSGDSMSRSIRIHPSKLYTGPRPRGKLWSSTVFFSGFLFQQSSTTSTSSPFTSFCIFHYQLHCRDYGGSLAHCLQLHFQLYAAGMYISRFAEQKGPGHLSY